MGQSLSSPFICFQGTCVVFDITWESSNVSVHKLESGVLSNMQTPGHTPRDADTVGLGGAQEFTFVTSILGNCETGGPQTTF